MPKNYRTTIAQKVSETTVGALQYYLKMFIRLEFPDSHIEFLGSHWSKVTEGQNKKLPKLGIKAQNFDHVAAYCREARTEGRLIDLRLVLVDDSTLPILKAKSMTGEIECWEIARSLSNAIELLYASDELPLAVNLALKLPMNPETIKIHGDHVLHISIGQDHIDALFDDKELVDRMMIPFSLTESEKHVFVSDFVSDWRRIAKNLDMGFSSNHTSETLGADDDERDVSGMGM